LSRRPRIARWLFQQVALPAAASRLAVDVVHSPAFIIPFWRGDQRHLLTVYDLSAFMLPETHITIRRGRLYRRAVARSIRGADRVVVLADTVKADILALIPGADASRISVIPAGVGDEFRRIPASVVRSANESRGLTWPYILYVGTIEARKNLSLLVEAYRQLLDHSSLPEHLVLAGRPGLGYESIREVINAFGLERRIHLAGYVPQSDLPSLYAGASLFVFPSLQEGFGFPPLEAMACGVPTIATRTSSLAENLAGAAELVDPHDSGALAAAMGTLLRDETLRAERRAAGIARAARYRWETTAQEVRACYEQLAASR
jgi:glycosyltransferase involved in cell wall biosynthesis